MVRDTLREMLIKERPEADALAEAIRDICGRMRAVDLHFSEETDSDLLDAYIYERLSLQAQYRFLTRQARRRVSKEKGAEIA